MNLHDCQHHGAEIDNELIVVEGLSAAANVRRGRDAKSQAVLALQGKPINAAKASRTRVEQNIELQALKKALGCASHEQFKLDKLRYRRLVLLFDPDADGIHCAALVQIYLQKFMPTLITEGKVIVVRAPLMEISVPGSAPVHAYSEQHHQKLKDYFSQNNISGTKIQRFKGVASLSVPLLREKCLQQDTRTQQALTSNDAMLALKIFG